MYLYWFCFVLCIDFVMYLCCIVLYLYCICEGFHTKSDKCPFSVKQVKHGGLKKWNKVARSITRHSISSGYRISKSSGNSGQQLAEWKGKRSKQELWKRGGWGYGYPLGQGSNKTNRKGVGPLHRWSVLSSPRWTRHRKPDEIMFWSREIMITITIMIWSNLDYDDNHKKSKFQSWWFTSLSWLNTVPFGQTKEYLEI